MVAVAVVAMAAAAAAVRWDALGEGWQLPYSSSTTGGRARDQQISMPSASGEAPGERAMGAMGRRLSSRK